MNLNKKAISLVLCLALLLGALCGALGEGDAEAATRRLRLGSSIYVIEIDGSYLYGELTGADIEDDQVGYFYSNEKLLDFDVYQTLKQAESEDLAAYAAGLAANEEVSELVTDATVNDIPVAYFRTVEEYEGESYETLTYLLDDGEHYIRIVFWLDGEEAEAEVAAIMASLSYVDVQQIQLGDSPYSVMALSNFVEGELTEEDIEQGQVAYYQSDETLLDFDVYEISKVDRPDTLAAFAIEEASKYENVTEMVTNWSINDIPVARYRTTETYEGVEYETLTCILEDSENYIEIVFWLDGKTAQSEASAILLSLWHEDEKSSQTEVLENGDYQFMLGTSAYAIVIPEDYRLGVLSQAAIDDGLIGYFYSDESLMDFEAYQFSKEGLNPSAAGYITELAAEYATVMELVTDGEINGIPVVWLRAMEEYEGVEYETITYVLDDDDEFVLIEYWLDGENAEAEKDAIMQTLSIVGEIEADEAGDGEA